MARRTKPAARTARAIRPVATRPHATKPSRVSTRDAKAAGQPARLAAALVALAHGLPNPWDESTDYFHSFVAPLPATTPLDNESFRQALSIGARYSIVLASANDTLTELGNAVDDWGPDIAGGFRQLAEVMRATLTELSLAYARGNGVIRVRVWLFGRTDDGTLVGLRSISTET